MDFREQEKFIKQSHRANVASEWARTAMRWAAVLFVVALAARSMMSDVPLIQIAISSGVN